MTESSISSSIISVFLFVSLVIPRLIREGDFKTRLIVFMEAVVLDGVHGDCTLERVLEIHETEVKLPATLRSFFD